jgi:signal transduction histidine kinase
MADGDFQTEIAAVTAIAAVPTILNVVCRVTGMGFAAIARVTDQRWVCLAVNDEISFGLKPGGELKVDTTICNEVRQNRAATIIDHVAEDEDFKRHPTPAMYGFQSYISVPIFLKNGSFFGTLCAIDPKPAKLKNPAVIGMFELFAELIAFHLDAGRQLAEAQASLLDAHAVGELRDQFIAVLGHDLRNPLGSMAAGTQLLRATPLSEKAQSILAMMDKSILRMTGLITNVLDFARGRLGGGIIVHPSAEALAPVLQQVIDELQSIHREHRIVANIDLAHPVVADAPRIGQLFSNLLANALDHSFAGEPVRVTARTSGESFELVVCNKGEPIPSLAMDRLFQPFARGDVRPNQQGLGLGLYIASEIARAHRGTICVTSSVEETAFTFTMPSRAIATSGSDLHYVASANVQALQDGAPKLRGSAAAD